MRDRNGADAAERAHRVDGRIVDQRDAVPHEVALRRANEQGALTDRECRLGANAHQAQVLANLVVMRLAKLVEGGPWLPGPADVLPVVLTDWAAFRRLCRGRELDPTGEADVALGQVRTIIPAPVTTRGNWPPVPYSEAPHGAAPPVQEHREPHGGAAGARTTRAVLRPRPAGA